MPRTKKAGITLSEDERTELKSLRQEVKTPRVEKDILKKSAPFFRLGNEVNFNVNHTRAVFDSDRGFQYTSKRFGKLLKGHGIRASMGDVGGLLGERRC